MTIPKFRAYHKEYKSMKPVLELDLNPDKGVFVESKQPEHDDSEYKTYGEYWFWREIELMQFTGLQDHTGEDIYQGDIIQIMTPYSEKHLAHVVWDISNAMSIWEIGETWMLHFLNGIAKDRNAPLYPYCQPRSGVEITVIGTIYQHPELLEQQP